MLGYREYEKEKQKNMTQKCDRNRGPGRNKYRMYGGSIHDNRGDEDTGTKTKMLS